MYFSIKYRYSNILLKQEGLGPSVTHLRMTDQRSGTFCEILVECIMRNNSVKLFLSRVSGSEEDVV